MPWFLHIPTSERQKLINLNQKKKKVILEELAPAFILLFLSVKPFLLFPTSCIGKKQFFNKGFDINCRPLVKDHIRKEVNLSFTGCLYFLTIKINRA